MVAEFFSLHVLLLQHHRLTTRPFCFQKAVLLQKLVVSPLPTDPSLFSKHTSCLLEPPLPHHIWDCVQDASAEWGELRV